MESIIMQPTSRKAIEAIAKKILLEIQPNALQCDEPVDVEYLFSDYIPLKLGIKTMYTDLSALPNNVLGYTDASQNISCIDKSLSDSNELSIGRRFRSTVAHESGHCIMHVPYLRSFISSSCNGNSDTLYRCDTKSMKPYENPEWQAWEFAGSLLMPQNRVQGYFAAGLDLIDMANIFDVNPSYMKVRLKKLKLI